MTAQFVFWSGKQFRCFTNSVRLSDKIPTNTDNSSSFASESDIRIQSDFWNLVFSFNRDGKVLNVLMPLK